MLTAAKELKDKIGQTVKAGCRSCRQDTNHLILACFEQKDNQKHEGEEYDDLYYG